MASRTAAKPTSTAAEHARAAASERSARRGTTAPVPAALAAPARRASTRTRIAELTPVGVCVPAVRAWRDRGSAQRSHADSSWVGRVPVVSLGSSAPSRAAESSAVCPAGRRPPGSTPPRPVAIIRLSRRAARIRLGPLLIFDRSDPAHDVEVARHLSENGEELRERGVGRTVIRAAGRPCTSWFGDGYGRHPSLGSTRVRNGVPFASGVQ